jgi:hypothetical protein
MMMMGMMAPSTASIQPFYQMDNKHINSINKDKSYVKTTPNTMSEYSPSLPSHPSSPALEPFPTFDISFDDDDLEFSSSPGKAAAFNGEPEADDITRTIKISTKHGAKITENQSNLESKDSLYKKLLHDIVDPTTPTAKTGRPRQISEWDVDGSDIDESSYLEVPRSAALANIHKHAINGWRKPEMGPITATVQEARYWRNIVLNETLEQRKERLRTDGTPSRPGSGVACGLSLSNSTLSVDEMPVVRKLPIPPIDKLKPDDVQSYDTQADNPLFSMVQAALSADDGDPDHESEESSDTDSIYTIGSLPSGDEQRPDQSNGLPFTTGLSGFPAHLDFESLFPHHPSTVQAVRRRHQHFATDESTPELDRMYSAVKRMERAIHRNSHDDLDVLETLITECDSLRQLAELEDFRMEMHREFIQLYRIRERPGQRPIPIRRFARELFP